MELPLDLVPLIVNAADCNAAATLAQVCKTAYAAVGAKHDALVAYGPIQFDNYKMWLRGMLFVFDGDRRETSIYYIISGPNHIDIEYNYELSTARITPPKMLVSKYYAVMCQKKIKM